MQEETRIGYRQKTYEVGPTFLNSIPVVYRESNPVCGGESGDTVVRGKGNDQYTNQTSIQLLSDHRNIILDDL